MRTVQQLKVELSEALEAFEKDVNNANLIYDFEDELNEAFRFHETDKKVSELKKLRSELKDFKDEHGFYDEESELDNMFPDRHEEGFDEDSMSYDSVFGDD